MMLLDYRTFVHYFGDYCWVVGGQHGAMLKISRKYADMMVKAAHATYQGWVVGHLAWGQGDGRITVFQLSGGLSNYITLSAKQLLRVAGGFRNPDV